MILYVPGVARDTESYQFAVIVIARASNSFPFSPFFKLIQDKPSRGAERSSSEALPPRSFPLPHPPPPAPRGRAKLLSHVCEMSRLTWKNLHGVVILLTRIVLQRSTHVCVHRVCGVTWRARLYGLSRVGLLRKLRYLINHLDLRMIVKCFNRGLFADDPDILHIAYGEVVRRGVRDTAYVEALVKKYEYLRGKGDREVSLTCGRQLDA